jgi:MFS family permease
LVFSIKQTAVPVGLVLAGLLGPLLTEWSGWRSTLLLVGAACFAFALTLEPLRHEFDADRVPTRAFRISDFWTTLTTVTRHRDLRRLSLACFAFNGLQTVFTAYFVIYLTVLGYDLAAAGFVFSLTMLVAIPCRIFWGWLGSSHVTPGRLMGWLAIGMALSSILIGLYGPAWPTLLIGFAAVGLSATAMSWHGVLLAEIVRVSPVGRRGAATGGVLSFGQIGALLLPLAYSFVLSLTGQHGFGFILCGLPALAVGVTLVLTRQEQSRAS